MFRLALRHGRLIHDKPGFWSYMRTSHGFLFINRQAGNLLNKGGRASSQDKRESQSDNLIGWADVAARDLRAARQNRRDARRGRDYEDSRNHAVE